jgi:hypothetical protein
MLDLKVLPLHDNVVGGPLSPVVKHKRTTAPGRRGNAISRGRMLLIASISSGLVALILAFILLITGVGIYAVLIWPLTFWDLASLGEHYSGWTWTLALTVFGGGALAGYSLFSGALFKVRQKNGSAVRGS